MLKAFGAEVNVQGMEKFNRKGVGRPLGPEQGHKKIKGGAPGIICPKCHAVYFGKRWHPAKELAKAYAASEKIVYELCPEDKEMRKGHGAMGYEGEVILKNIPNGLVAELEQEIRNIGKRAESRDPEDKIIKIERTAGGIRVLTSENQLAASIGRQVARAHKGGQLEIKWSKGDAPARVIWNYKK